MGSFKKKIGPLLLYDNFEFMFYDIVYPINMGTSLWQGGNKEFCNNLQALAERSSTMLKVLYIEARDTLENFIKNKS